MKRSSGVNLIEVQGKWGYPGSEISRVSGQPANTYTAQVIGQALYKYYLTLDVSTEKATTVTPLFEGEPAA